MPGEDRNRELAVSRIMGFVFACIVSVLFGLAAGGAMEGWPALLVGILVGFGSLITYFTIGIRIIDENTRAINLMKRP